LKISIKCGHTERDHGSSRMYDLINASTRLAASLSMTGKVAFKINDLSLIILLFSTKSSFCLPQGFVYLNDPRIIVTLMYAGNDNFMGRPAKGYIKNNCCIVTTQAAQALKKAQDLLEKQHKRYHLHVYDAYRPQQAVDDFMAWGKTDDTATKQKYYPALSKEELFKKNYIFKQSSHSRGSTVDVTICMVNKDGAVDDIDMGTIVDFFGEQAHTDTALVSQQAQRNRALLTSIMQQAGFKGCSLEWWHFTLRNEPFGATHNSSYHNFLVQ